MRSMLALGVTMLALAVAAQAHAWEVACRDDAVEDVRLCVIHSSEILPRNLRVVLASDVGPMVSFGVENRPGSDEVVRIDDNRPIRWDTTNEHSPEQAIQQMIKGRILRFRWTEWPNTDHDGQVSLQGFTAALEEAKRRAAAYKTGQ